MVLVFGQPTLKGVDQVHLNYFKVALWTRDSTRDEVNFRIGQIVKEKLEIPDSESLRYEVHKDSSARTCSVVKPKIVIPPKDTTAAAVPRSTVPTS